MNIYDSVDWNIDKGVGGEVGTCDNGRVYRNTDGKVGSGYVEEV